MFKLVLRKYCAFPITRQLSVFKKSSGRRAKRNEIWDPVTLVIHIRTSIFGIVAFKVTLQLFGALPSKWPEARKRLVVQQKQGEIWVNATLITHICNTCTFDLVMFTLFWGHSMDFLKMACNSKKAGYIIEQNNLKFAIASCTSGCLIF